MLLNQMQIVKERGDGLHNDTRAFEIWAFEQQQIITPSSSCGNELLTFFGVIVQDSWANHQDLVDKPFHWDLYPFHISPQLEKVNKTMLGNVTPL